MGYAKQFAIPPLDPANSHIGAFDIVSEFLPHLAIILYRVYPNQHNFLSKLFRLACITTVTGTIAETIITMWLFGVLWPRWTIAFKLTTPMLHILFMSAQLWGSWNFYKMYKRQVRFLDAERGGLDIEAKEAGVEAASRGGTGVTVESKDTSAVTVTSSSSTL
jgi:hypothetical protein